MQAITTDMPLSASQSWVVTDNTTLTGAAIVFRELERDTPVIHQHALDDWLSFLQGVVLHDVMLADSNVFASNPVIRELADKFPERTTGFELPERHRHCLKTSVRKQCQSLRTDLEAIVEKLPNHKGKINERAYNRTYSEMHRSLFYVAVADMMGLSYRPSCSRELFFSAASSFEPLSPKVEYSDAAGNLTTTLFTEIEKSASQYKATLKELSGTRLLYAQLPPIAMLIIDNAIKMGSWSEAIEALRNSRGCEQYCLWVEEVNKAISTGDLVALKELNATRDLIRGWANDPDEGVLYKKRTVGIGQLSELFTLPLSFQLNDPIISKPKHLLFLNGAFKASIKPLSFSKLRKIRF